MFSRTSLNSLWKVSPTCQGKGNWNLLSRDMHMSRDFHIPLDMHYHVVGICHIKLKQSVRLYREPALNRSSLVVLISNPPFLPTAVVIHLFYFHRETTDNFFREWLERAGMPKVSG